MTLMPLLAERTLDAKGAVERVLVRVGIPRKFEDDSGWYCPYQILGAGEEQIRFGGGIDAIQAVQLSMFKIGAELEFLNKKFDLGLSWHGSADLGFGRVDE